MTTLLAKIKALFGIKPVSKMSTNDTGSSPRHSKADYARECILEQDRKYTFKRLEAFLDDVRPQFDEAIIKNFSNTLKAAYESGATAPACLDLPHPYDLAIARYKDKLIFDVKPFVNGLPFVDLSTVCDVYKYIRYHITHTPDSAVDFGFELEITSHGLVVNREDKYMWRGHNGFMSFEVLEAMLGITKAHVEAARLLESDLLEVLRLAYENKPAGSVESLDLPTDFALET